MQLNRERGGRVGIGARRGGGMGGGSFDRTCIDETMPINQKLHQAVGRDGADKRCIRADLELE